MRENFKRISVKKTVVANTALYRLYRKSQQRLTNMVFHLFRGYRVVSVEDYADGVRDPKDVIYDPRSADDALTIEKIQQSRFYFLPHELITLIHYAKTRYGDLEDVNFREVTLAALIYHPQYGDAYRDEQTGILMMKGPDGEYRKFSAEHLRRMYGAFEDVEKGGISDGRKFFRTVTPQLLEKGLVKMSDIGVQSVEASRTETDKRMIGRRGTVMFDKVRHTLGSQYENHLAYNLGERCGAVVAQAEDGTKNVVATFNIVPYDQAKTDVPLQSYKIANIKQAHPQAFDETYFYHMHEGEDIAQYKKRIETIESLQILLHSEKYLQEQLGISLEKFSFAEQMMIARMLNSVSVLHKEKIDHFIRIFGNNGLKSFLSLEHGGHDMGNKILRIGEKYDQNTADAIFAKYAELADVTDNIDAYVKTQFQEHEDVDRKKIGEKLLVDAKNLLESYADREDTARGEEIIAALEKINARVALTAEIIQQLPRESVAHLDLTKLSDVERHIDLTAQNLHSMPELLAKMEAVVHDKFPTGDAQSFREDCLSERNNGVTVTLANGEILSFFMKKKVGEHLSELDWFSANPDAPIKGIGEATALLGFNHARDKDENYYAVAKPHIKSLSTLIELQGFVGFGGMTKDGEYKHHYMRTRRLAHEMPYHIKQLSQNHNNALLHDLQTTCEKSNTTYSLQYQDRTYDVARVTFLGVTHEHDVTDKDEHGWLYQEMQRQTSKGSILVRYIPASDAKDNVTYYAVFAPDHSTADERREVEDYVRSKDVHSA